MTLTWSHAYLEPHVQTSRCPQDRASHGGGAVTDWDVDMCNINPGLTNIPQGYSYMEYNRSVVLTLRSGWDALNFSFCSVAAAGPQKDASASSEDGPPSTES